MATNLVSLVTQFLTPDVIRRIASGFGLDSNTVQSVMRAGVPGLLAGLSGVAAMPGGPQKLVEAAKQETGTPGNLADMLAGSGQSSLMAHGSQLLGSLLGARDQNTLAEVTGRFAGLSQSNSSSLLRMLAPLVMGTIAQHPDSLNPNGMASLLASQKNNIAAALLSGFSNMLSGTELLDSLGDAAGVADQATRTAGSAVYSAGSAGQHAGTGAAARWLWLIPAAVIVAALAYWLNGPAQQAAQHVATMQGLTMAGVDVGKRASESLTNLRTTLSGVIPSAKAALPKLQEVTGQIDKTDGIIGSLSAEQRKSIAKIVNPRMTVVNQLFEKVLTIPGVDQVLTPTIDTVKAKLATLTTWRRSA